MGLCRFNVKIPDMAWVMVRVMIIAEAWYELTRRRLAGRKNEREEGGTTDVTRLVLDSFWGRGRGGIMTTQIVAIATIIFITLPTKTKGVHLMAKEAGRTDGWKNGGGTVDGRLDGRTDEMKEGR
jgi:hypothetical protein